MTNVLSTVKAEIVFAKDVLFTLFEESSIESEWNKKGVYQRTYLIGIIAMAAVVEMRLTEWLIDLIK